MKDTDDRNDWLIWILEEEEPNECTEDVLVFDDDYLIWGNVIRAAGVEEEIFNMWSRGGSLEGHINEVYDMSYKFCDDNDDGFMLSEDDCIAYVKHRSHSLTF